MGVKGSQVGGQGGCESWRSEAFVKIKTIFFSFFGGGRVGGWGVRVDSEAFVKIKKKIGSGGVGLGGQGGC